LMRLFSRMKLEVELFQDSKCWKIKMNHYPEKNMGIYLYNLKT